VEEDAEALSHWWQFDSTVKELRHKGNDGNKPPMKHQVKTGHACDGHALLFKVSAQYHDPADREYREHDIGETVQGRGEDGLPGGRQW
jgi:hypothetical protein